MGVADNKMYKDQYHFNPKFFNPVKKDDLPSLNVDSDINSTIKENPYRANVEIEKDEIILQPDMSALFKAVGKKHSQGGISVTLRPNSFVFSDDKTLAINKREHELFELKEGGNFKPDKNTPAEVLKRNVDIKHYNRLTSNLADPKKDDLAKKSSAMMLEKYLQTIGNVAFIQEEKKNFPTGVPEFAANTAPVYNPDLKNSIMEQKQYAKYGGKIGNPYKEMDEMQWGGIFAARQAERMRREKQNPPATPPIPASRGTLFGPKWTEIVKNDPDAFILSPEAAKELPQYYPGMQHKRSNGLYGEEDWSVDNFKNRHQWYFNQNQNFDYKNPKDVRAFQEAYNSKATELGYTNYFVPNGGAKSVDGKLGEYTYNAPGFKDKPFKIGPNPVTEDCPCGKDEYGCIPCKPDEPVIQKDTAKPSPGEINGPLDNWKTADWEFTPWQNRSYAYALGKYASAKRYMPYRSRFNATYAEPSLLNPEQGIADMKASSYMQMRGNQTLSPILQGVSNSAAQGQVMNAAPGYRNQVDNQNSQIINQFRSMNNQTKNNETAVNMQNDGNYYKDSITGLTNHDKMRSYLLDQAEGLREEQAGQNQGLAYKMLTQNDPAYAFDWKSGNFRRNQKDIRDVQGSAQGDYLQSLLGNVNFSSLTNSEKIQFIREIQRGKALQYMNPYFGQTPPPYKKGGSVRNPYK